MDWNRDFEVPDVAAFADFLWAPRAFLHSIARGEPGVHPHFVVPSLEGEKLRLISVLDCGELVAYSAATARIASKVDRLLGREVFHTRLLKGPPKWSLHPHVPRHRAFRYRATSALKRRRARVLGVEDVRAFFGSISAERLDEELRGARCEERARNWVSKALSRWQSTDGLAGIPIGPDASRLLGTAFLLSVDIAIASTGVQHLRWVDDILLLSRDLTAVNEAAAAGSAALSEIGLEFSTSKSRRFSDPDAAIAYIEDDLLTSLTAIANRDSEWAAREAMNELEMLAEGESEPSGRRFRFCLKVLRKREDGGGVALLAANPALAAIDPRETGTYVSSVGIGGGSAADDILGQLSASPREGRDVLDLQWLRAASYRSWGTSEGGFFQAIASDETRSAPVRAWAHQAWARTPAWTVRRAEQAADGEADGHVRRAALVPLKRRGRRTFLAHIEASHPELRHTVRWLSAA